MFLGINAGMFERISIIGDGAMGSVCAMMLCGKGLDVVMWGFDSAQLRETANKRENTKFLPGHSLPESLRYEPDDTRAMRDAQLVVSAIPCQFMRKIWRRLKGCCPDGVPIVSVTKGIENDTLLRPTEILADILGTDRRYAALSGPTIADELAAGMPATATVASVDFALAESIQSTFNSSCFRVYTNDDIIGVELCGAVKNVIAIAAGIIDGVGLGDNAKAALLTRGLAEIARLGTALGARQATFSGLSGLGDLVTTCISPKGRNRSFGQRVGSGMSASQALAATQSVVEGASTCSSVLELAARHRVEMPICEAVGCIIAGRKTVSEAISDLMSRQLKSE